MVRSILRHVQNTLMVMSALLVMLAFERLQSLDDTGIYKASAPSSLWPHPPYIDGSSPDEGEAPVPSIRIGSRHQLVFGHELRIGLFRFVLPRLKRTHTTTPASTLRKQFHSNNWGDKSQETNDNAQEKQRAPTVAYAVPIESCSPNIIDAAHVLQHSLRNGTLYAFLLNDATVQCAPMLKGIRLVSPKEAYPNFDPSCVSKEALSLLLAHGLDADVIVYIPLPSLALSPNEYSLPSLSTITSRFLDDSRKHKETSMQVASNVLSVQTTRPQGKEVVTRALDTIAKQCHSPHNATNLDFLVPWETCLDIQGCHISESISIATFADCPLPWSNDTSGKATCQALQKQWLRAREFIGTK